MWLWMASALAMPGDWTAPPEFVRVEDPDHPGAISRSATAALLEAPPAGDVPWRWETVAVPDQAPDDLAVEGVNADAWHAAGHTGAGVRVAVFDIQWEAAGIDDPGLADLESADCWRHPTCEAPLETLEARFGYERGVHGWACAGVIRDIAPDAEILPVRVNSFTSFQSAVDWAIRHDVDIVSISMSFFNESFYDGSGPFAAPMRRLAAHGILPVVSAGNYAGNHWAGRWRDPDGDRVMSFGDRARLPLEVRSRGRRTLFVAWDEYGACGLSDLDVVVYDDEGFIVGRSTRDQTFGARGCEPVERVSMQADAPGTYHLEVVARRVVAADLAVDVFALGIQLDAGTGAGSMADPAVFPQALTVGAVDAAAYLAGDVEPFSSLGPVRSGVPKPDLVGPDGLTTDAYGTRGFFGTSASAPAVAAVAALVWGREPALTAEQVADRLRASAWREGPRVHDPALGYGKVRLPPPDVPSWGCGTGATWALLPLLILPVRRRRGRA